MVKEPSTSLISIRTADTCERHTRKTIEPMGHIALQAVDIVALSAAACLERERL